MLEALKDMTVAQVAVEAGLILAGLATIIQITPIKINPWSALAKAIGRAINRDVIEKVEKLDHDLKEFKNASDEREAKAARTRILRFGDEVVHGVKHSKEHFDDILDDMTEYDRYCEEHPLFKNNRTKATSKLILTTYDKCMEDQSFI